MGAPIAETTPNVRADYVGEIAVLLTEIRKRNTGNKSPIAREQQSGKRKGAKERKSAPATKRERRKEN